jgi:transcriptional regulator with XRE-family HTH domain
MPDEPPAYTGDDLRRFRVSRGWTLAELARWSGYSRSTLSRAERGLWPVPLPLCRILQLSGINTRREN